MKIKLVAVHMSGLPQNLELEKFLKITKTLGILNKITKRYVILNNFYIYLTFSSKILT